MDILGKLQKIEALIAGAKTEGEKQAAQFAKRRLQKKFGEKPVEYSIRVNSLSKKKLFVAICQKHGIRTYRYRGQKHTTTMLMVGKSFLDEVLWPEFKKYAKLLDEFVDEIMQDLISQIHQVEEEEEIVKTPALLS